MQFSDNFHIVKTSRDDWFDLILSVDSELFLDPFLLYAWEHGCFKGSHKEVISFFNYCFKLIALSNGDKGSVHYRRAVDLLLFPEVEELCLGYTFQGTRGSGSGRELAELTARGMWKAIKRGLKEISHFEEIALLQEGIGADRISDMTAGILRKRIAEYTMDMCQRHKVPLKTTRFVRGHFDKTTGRWKPLIAQLPINPYNGKSILLVPRQYLRTLPSINADDFWGYCWDNENDTIRREFNYDVSSRVRKKDIVKLARRQPRVRKDYIAYREANPTEGYDFYKDPAGIAKWYEETKKYFERNPWTLEIQSKKDFVEVVDHLISDYKHYVEEERGWALLWNDNRTPKNEKAAQHLFLGIVKHACQANNIDISREADVGRGPVDFKMSKGYKLRALLEVKLAKNSKFWAGLQRQLPSYQKAAAIDEGYFIVIAYAEKDFERIRNIQDVVYNLNKKANYNIKTVIIDASRDKPSASKL